MGADLFIRLFCLGFTSTINILVNIKALPTCNATILEHHVGGGGGWDMEHGNQIVTLYKHRVYLLLFFRLIEITKLDAKTTYL